MTAEPPVPPEAPAPAQPAGRAPRRRTPRVGLAVLAVLVLLAAAMAVLRFGVLTGPGRALIVAELDGLSLGAFGRLHVEGLEGDVWRDFSLARLTVSDRQGVWLEARQAHVRWRWQPLLVRRVHVDALEAAQLSVLRRPTLAPSAPGRGPGLSIHIGRFFARLETAPAFSYRRGLYDVTGALDAAKSGAVAGRLLGVSLLHRGDRIETTFDLGRNKSLALDLEGREAQGGALAGALGLAADQPFLISVHARGTTSRGSFQALSRSGALTPLQAAGAWTPAGGSAAGRLTLAASRLLTGYQKMLGPEARFSASGAKVPDGFYTLDLSATSENVRLAAKGEADLGRMAAGPRGLAVTLAAVSASRILGWPQMGGAQLAGVLSGGGARWTLAGQLAVEGASAWNYRLARVRGPGRLVWQKGEIGLDIALDGEGGAGSGLAAALLGARPHAAAGLTWLPDGRLNMRSLELFGPGLKLSAVGQQTLFGGLALKGEASFANFAAARAGARGSLRASWNAGQAKAGAPWTFSADAGATGFASGIDPLDRLLGAAPRLTLKASYDGAGVQVTGAELRGANGGMTAAGQIRNDGGLDAKLGWTAKGPFEIGPLEVSLAGKGGGTLGGSLSDPRADLAADFDSVDLPNFQLAKAHVTLSFLKGPEDTNGAFALTASSRYGPAKAATAFRFLKDGLQLTGLDATAAGAHVEGSVALLAGAPSSANLVVAVGPGVFLTRGQASGRLTIEDRPGGPTASVTANASGAVLPVGGGFIVQSATVKASGPLARLPYQLQANGLTAHGSWKVAGAGLAAAAGPDHSVSFAGAGRLRNADFKTLAPAELRFGPKGASLSLLAEAGGGRARIEATQSQAAFQAKAELSDVSLGLLDQDFMGKFDAALTLAGQGPSLGGSLDAQLQGAGERGSKGAPTVDGLVKARLAANVLSLDATLGNASGLKTVVNVALPAEASAAPFRIAIVRNRAIHGEVAAEGEIKPVWDLVMGGSRSLAGQVNAHAVLGGTLADPRVEGQATVAGGQFSDADSGLKLRAVALSARLADNAVDVSQFQGTDGAGGSVTGAGRISLLRDGASSFRLDLKSFRLIDNDVATALASGQATVNRAADGKVKIAGALSIDRADLTTNPPVPSDVTPLDVVEVNREVGAGGHLQTESTHAPDVELDVSLKAPGRIFLRGRGLNAELSLDARVTGSALHPKITGEARIVRGDYDFAGKRFVFDNQGRVYLAEDPNDIRLDLTATRDDPSLTAVIRIQGTAARPKITLSSTPALPSDEVLSKVLFGASASQLSPYEAAELASAVSTVAGGGGFDVLGSLRSFAHLDRLALGGAASSGFAVSGGKYLTDNVYLELTGGGRQGPSAQVEWRARRDISVISSIAGAGGDSQVSVRWRKDY